MTQRIKFLISVMVALAAGLILLGFITHNSHWVYLGIVFLQSGWIPILLIFGLFWIVYALLENAYGVRHQTPFHKPLDIQTISLREMAAIATQATSLNAGITGKVSEVTFKKEDVFIYLNHRKEFYIRIPAFSKNRFRNPNTLLGKRIIVRGMVVAIALPLTTRYEITLEQPSQLEIRSLFN